MTPFITLADLWASGNSELFKLLLSAGSLVLTLYFWLIRSNRERVSVGIYPAGNFEGALEPGGVGVWSGRLYLANRSILPTAIVAAKVELWWHGEWIVGNCVPRDGSELPWNLPPTQVFPKDLQAAFDVGEKARLDKIYANQRLRWTFATVEGVRLLGELETQRGAIAA